MGIETIFANVSCSDLPTSEAWYEKLFGKPPERRPMPGLAEWSFSETAQMQLFQAPEHAGHCTLTIGVNSLEEERKRLIVEGIVAGKIEQAEKLSLMRLRDPDKNLIVLVSAN